MTLYTATPQYYGNVVFKEPTNPATDLTSLTLTAGGTANTYTASPSTWVAAASSTDGDIYGFDLWVVGSSGTGDRSTIIDIGWDTAGGTSYTWYIQKVVTGNAGTASVGAAGHRFFFPIRIPAGSTVAVKSLCNQASITNGVTGRFYRFPSNNTLFKVGSFSETIGTVTDCQGTAFTPGNAADGAWTSLGTTTNPMWWWQLGYQVSNAALTSEYTYIELAWGDSTNKHPILKEMHIGVSSVMTSCGGFKSNVSHFQGYCPVPAGTTIYVRGRCNNAPDTVYNAVAIGIGG